MTNTASLDSIRNSHSCTLLQEAAQCRGVLVGEREKERDRQRKRDGGIKVGERGVDRKSQWHRPISENISAPAQRQEHN